jgi:hypothetical protein
MQEIILTNYMLKDITLHIFVRQMQNQTISTKMHSSKDDKLVMGFSAN